MSCRYCVGQTLQCSSVSPTRSLHPVHGLNGNWVCTRSAGHAGSHVACSASMCAFCIWPNVDASEEKPENWAPEDEELEFTEKVVMKKEPRHKKVTETLAEYLIRLNHANRGRQGVPEDL